MQSMNKKKSFTHYNIFGIFFWQEKPFDSYNNVAPDKLFTPLMDVIMPTCIALYVERINFTFSII